jgi:hypothetical protein
MNAHEDGSSRELVPDDWRELDDTLADGPAPADVPAPARAWLADQRAMHGLLRALHTQDAAAREARVEAILERIDGGAGTGAGVGEPRGRWLIVTAAALLLACAGVWLALPASLPTAAAAVQRVAHELARDVARRFQVTVSRVGGRGKEVSEHRFALVVRPGGKFRVDGRVAFGGMQFGEFTAGSDGRELWVLGGNGMLRQAVPVEEREGLERRFGDVVDLGYLDVHDLVRRLPADFELAVVGRERSADGRDVLRIACTRKQTSPRAKLTHAWLLCDEATGMITRLEAEAEFAGGGVRRLSMEYLGEEPSELAAFTRPW